MSHPGSRPPRVAARARTLAIAVLALAAACDAPLEPSLPGRPLVDVEAGQDHTCALDSSGAAFCWGWDNLGRLGKATAPDYCAAEGCSRPVRVGGGLRFSQLALAEQHTCGLAGTTAYCWGSDRYDQLGDGALTVARCATGQGGSLPCGRSPRPVAVGYALAAVTAGRQNACAISTGGRAVCWGWNLGGELGISDDPADRSREVGFEPTAVATDLRFSAISTDPAHTCALDTEGQAYCWGVGGAGSLGNAGNTASYLPGPVYGQHVFSAIDTGGGHACGIDDGSRLLCWGWGARGRLGLGDETSRRHPTAVPLPGPVVRVSAGFAHTCAILGDGRLFCWGDNGAGQVGVGGAGFVVSPSQVALPAAAIDIAAGGRHTCAILDDSTAWCWGANDHGQLGIGLVGAAVPTPTPVQE